MALHVSSDNRQLITRRIAEKDTITLWDIRKQSVPVLEYISVLVSKGEKCASNRISVFKDRILSCVTQDGNARIWNVTNGNLLLELDQTNSKPFDRLKHIMFNDKYIPLKGSPAIFAITENSFGWYSLSQQLS